MRKLKKTSIRCKPTTKVSVKFPKPEKWPGKPIPITLRGGSLDGRFSSVGDKSKRLIYKTGEVYLITLNRDHNNIVIFELEHV